MLFEVDAGRPGPLRSVAVAVIVAVVLMTGSRALAETAQDPSDSPLGANAASDVPVGEREVERFLDEAVARQLEEYEVPGATVSVVKDGKTILAKGFGEADVATGEPVVADETVFRMASLSKLFTATAVMRLAEEGRLDLDRDVNAYLDGVEVPDTYPGRPVTLRHLLTHTAGFEDRFTGSEARDASELEPLGKYLAEGMPARVRPPGEVMAYSNYGVALAGHVVEEVSGQRFDGYVEENVLDPLGMQSTTFAQPAPSELWGRMTPGYEVTEGQPVAREPAGYPREAPAAAGITTATDMARFMIAHLQDGRYGGKRVLEEETAVEMHERQFANDPRLDGMALGFYEQTIGGGRAIEAAGGGLGYNARLVLFPERNLGVFVAYNSTGDGGTSPPTSCSAPSWTASTRGLCPPLQSPPPKGRPAAPSAWPAATASPAPTSRASRRYSRCSARRP